LTGNKRLSALFQSKYSWDLMAARGIWAFGPHPQTGPNVLVDDSIEGETDKSALKTVQESITLGFHWATREGPLCEEPVRGVKFRLIHATLSTESSHRGAGQIIPATRRAAYSAILTAQPRLMEPVLLVEIQTPPECLSAIYSLLAKRRGHVTKDWPRSGSTLSIVHSLLPAIDSFGFETDLRIITHGQAFCQSTFSHWEVVPGDPLDVSLESFTLEPADATALARDFMLKTRKRRGLSLKIEVETFFDK
jgi:U5 small nuclear ribonucleoprotein component